MPFQLSLEQHNGVAAFLSRVDRTDGCWLWQAGTCYPPGRPDVQYGKFYHAGHMVLAHRFSYETFIGAIPKGFTLDHLCRTTLCVNPTHVEPVLHIINVQRGSSRVHPVKCMAANRFCEHGHWMDVGNTYVRPKGNTSCRRCQALCRRRDRARKRANRKREEA